LHELDYWKESCFITLSYSDDKLIRYHETFEPTIHKCELQKFFKRLRKNTKLKLKYYACGEYGEKTNRPHYHAIIFGLGLSSHSIGSDGTLSGGPVYDSWNKGIIHMGTASWDSARYISGYIDKKYLGKLGDSLYKQKHKEPPFQLASYGFGLRFAVENKQQLAENLYTSIKGVKHKLPRYYIKKLNIDTTPSLIANGKRILENDIQLANKGINTISSYQKHKTLTALQCEANVKARVNVYDKRKKI